MILKMLKKKKKSIHNRIKQDSTKIIFEKTRTAPIGAIFICVRYYYLNKPSSTKRKLCTFKYTELHSDSLRDIENSTDLIIGELLANATLKTIFLHHQATFSFALLEPHYF